ncbi:MAG: TetR family transcriptional regulator [Oscillospiraceae bacterium]|nr:TetR family transcriptional regulator [Oscillospiraceae bacterium]
MADFIRARSPEHKEQRVAEIKAAAEALFAEKTYHEITLTAIAEKLSWTRAALYKYFTTKEEIFLLLCEEKRNLYFDALRAAFPEGCSYPLGVYARVWSGILSAHRDYLRYSDILTTIIETNVSVERLAEYKRNYFENAFDISERMHRNLGISVEDAYELSVSVHFHAVGLGGICYGNPLVQQAVELAGIEASKIDFQDCMRRFIEMNLMYYCGGKSPA